MYVLTVLQDFTRKDRRGVLASCRSNAALPCCLALVPSYKQNSKLGPENVLILAQCPARGPCGQAALGCGSAVAGTRP